MILIIEEDYMYYIQSFAAARSKQGVCCGEWRDEAVR
jgi:hypothetical protein